MRFRALLAAGMVAALPVAGCGTAEPAPEAGTDTVSAGFPVTVDGGAGKVTLAERPTRIVSLSPTTTEMLFAIAAGEQVVAVDDQSNHPEDAPRTRLSGFKPNADAIAGYEPDLVVLSFDSNKVVDSLAALKIPVYVAPAATQLEDAYRQIQDLGKLTGRTDAAVDLAGQMRDDIDKLIRDLPKRSEPLSYYYELDPQLHSATSQTFIGAVLTLAGLQSIADPADKEGSGYPQLSAEYVIDSNPDLIFLADTKCCGQSPRKVAERPGWDELTAVKSERVYALDDDIASRWGPRIVELVRIATEAAASVPA